MDEAIAVAHAWSDMKLAWIEEPIYPPDDHSGLARLRTKSRTPIAAGENISNFMEFKRLFDMGAVGIAQPSITKIGGVTEMRKIFALGEANGVVVVPHSPYFGPGLLASIHVCAASAREIPIEGDPADVGSLLENNLAALSRSPVPKPLCYAEPGAVIGPSEVAWCRSDLTSLTALNLGLGIHFLPEDDPMKSGKRLRHGSIDRSNLARASDQTSLSSI